MITIFDITDERIIQYQNLRQPRINQSNQSIFIAEGLKVTKKLLESSFEIDSFFALSEYYEEIGNSVINQRVSQEKQFTASKSLLNQIVGFNLHTGIMAVGIEPKAPALGTIKFPVVALNSIVDSENVGSIVRNCAAFGIQSIIVDSSSSSPFLRRSVRVSMGTIFSTDIYFVDNLVSTLKFIQNTHGATIIGAEISDKSTPLSMCSFAQKYVLIFGNESNGISREVLEVCHQIIHIPITNAIESINVASASAIFLHHATKVQEHLMV